MAAGGDGECENATRSTLLPAPPPPPSKLLSFANVFSKCRVPADVVRFAPLDFQGLTSRLGSERGSNASAGFSSNKTLHVPPFSPSHLSRGLSKRGRGPGGGGGVRGRCLRRLSHVVFAQPYRSGGWGGRVFARRLRARLARQPAPGPGKEPRRRGPAAAVALVPAAAGRGGEGGGGAARREGSRGGGRGPRREADEARRLARPWRLPGRGGGELRRGAGREGDARRREGVALSARPVRC